MRQLPVILGGSNERRSQSAAGLRNRRPLRHGGHGHQQRQRRANGEADEHRGQNPLVVKDLLAHQRADDGQQHAHLTRENAASRRGRRTHPLQRQDETGGGHNVEKLVDAHLAAGSRFLNIFNIRSVII